MRNRRWSRGFTLIELMFVVMIIGIIAAIALPNYMKMTKRAKDAVVIENMHTIQLTVESFAIMTVGRYPVAADAAGVKLEMPGGNYPKNPYTNAETVVVWDVDPSVAGQITISSVNTGYRIRGRGSNGFLKDMTGGY